MRLVANGPFDRDSALSALARHEIAGLSETGIRERTHRRIVLVEGEPVELELRFEPGGVLVSTGAGEFERDQIGQSSTDRERRSIGGNGADPDSIERFVRHWFDLDCDIASIDHRLAGHERFSSQVKERPGVRITRYPDPWEASVLVVLGQQVSLPAARTFGARLVDAYGEGRAGLRRFPEPGRVASEPTGLLRETLGVTGARARTIREVATMFAAEPDLDPGRLAALPGIGPWTVACVSIRAGSAADEFPASDAVLRRALGGVSAGEAERLALEWKPYRSYAAVRLWSEMVDSKLIAAG